MKFPVLKLAFLAVCLLGTASASAQAIIDQYNHRLKNAQAISPLTDEMFGEQVSLHDGNTTFRVTDVQLPTNGTIPVSVGRKFDVSAHYMDRVGTSALHHDKQFGQFWDLDVPYMRAISDLMRGWVGRNPADPYHFASQKRCSEMDEGPPPTKGVGYFSDVEYHPSQFFSGVAINIPGHGMEQIVRQAPKVIGGKTYIARTASNWQVSCVTALKNGTGEGFEVLLPDGTRYRFDWKYSRTIASIDDATCNPGEAPDGVMASPQSAQKTWMTTPNCQAVTALPRSEEFIYATHAVDRFGNTVTYDWQAAPSGDQLTQIVSSDNALIALTYSGAGKITAISANGRTWAYSYGPPGYFGKGSLQYVTLPGNNGRWSYDYGTGMLDINKYEASYVWRGCRVNIDTKTTSAAPGQAETNVVIIGHPSGASGKFEFRKVMHGTRHAESRCSWSGGNWFNTGGFTAIVDHSSAYQVPSLYRKTVTGPGLPARQWLYYYAPGWNPPYQSTTTVYSPDGISTNYTYGNNCYFPDYGPDCDTGLLLKKEVYADGQVRRKEQYSYLLSAAGQNYPGSVGTLLSSSGLWYGGSAFNRNRPLYRSIVTQDGVDFVWQVETGCVTAGAYCFDAEMRPMRVTSLSRPAL